MVVSKLSDYPIVWIRGEYLPLPLRRCVDFFVLTKGWIWSAFPRVPGKGNSWHLCLLPALVSEFFRYVSRRQLAQTQLPLTVPRVLHFERSIHQGTSLAKEPVRGKLSAVPDGVFFVSDIPAARGRSASDQNAISTLTNSNSSLSLIGMIARIILGGTSMSVDVAWETSHLDGGDYVRARSEKYGTFQPHMIGS